uniref:Tesmin/TSO1-like CXC domain-containing protein n=1 Tax=Branchiostoma floridae TaxID=7739 RepID=C3Y2P1_BRAFL|eukprot:XP_002609293.1 hypothetical protein BRAFLDRAFT_124738 [Branchiostoma floridae]
MASKRAALDTEPDAVDKAPTKPKPKRKKPSPPKTPKCGCRGDCRTRKCACGKKGEACGDSCKCTDCVNPFNILAEYNIDLSDVALDKCLMDNIYKVEDLRGRLEQSYELECCDESVQLKDMLPGVAHCPGEECGYEWHYSWCWDSFEDEENDPKYHCEKCRRCADCRWEHCERCNKCYFATHNFNPCPTCGKYDDDDDDEDSDYEERERCAMM